MTSSPRAHGPRVSHQLRQALATFAARDRVLVATDFDGVLAPLVDDPSTSRPVDGSIEALRAIVAAPATSAAIVSGRHLSALRQVTGVTPADDIVLIGSHGAEPDRALSLDVSFDDAARERLARATAALEAIIAAHPPTRIEHKPTNVVLHTRGVPDDIAAAATRAALAIDIPSVDVMHGKQMVELSTLSVTKGDALRALATEFEATAILYLGDDVTDERAFGVLADDDRNVTIKVGEGSTAAAFRINDSADVVAVLRIVLEQRDGPVTR